MSRRSLRQWTSDDHGPRAKVGFGGWRCRLVVAALGVVVLLDSRHQKAVAQDFLSTGVQTVANNVQSYVDTGKGGDYIDEVHVSFAVSTKSTQRCSRTVSGIRPPPQRLMLHGVSRRAWVMTDWAASASVVWCWALCRWSSSDALVIDTPWR